MSSYKVHIDRVKSLTMDEWSAQEVEKVKAVGNGKFNQVGCALSSVQSSRLHIFL